MIGVELTFKNIPKPDGTFETAKIKDCLVGQYGAPNSSEKMIEIHLPKTTDKSVDGSWVEYQGEDWYVTGTTIKQIENNTPTRWNRYAIAKAIKTW